MSARRLILRDKLALALLALALVVRLFVPSGWMPATGQSFAITLCSGGVAEAAWVDADGKLHKQVPAKSSDQHCAFAGLGLAMFGGDVPPAIAPLVPPEPVPAAHLARASIGQGLAAPPPPATGPPVIV